MNEMFQTMIALWWLMWYIKKYKSNTAGTEYQGRFPVVQKNNESVLNDYVWGARSRNQIYKCTRAVANAQ